MSVSLPAAASVAHPGRGHSRLPQLHQNGRQPGRSGGPGELTTTTTTDIRAHLTDLDVQP